MKPFLQNILSDSISPKSLFDPVPGFSLAERMDHYQNSYPKAAGSASWLLPVALQPPQSVLNLYYVGQPKLRLQMNDQMTVNDDRKRELVLMYLGFACSL